MLENISLEMIATPLSEESPAGEELRYTKVYDDIKEARRAEDDIPQGDWQRETKSADWDKVVRLSLDALTGQTRDFQIAAWLTEALAMEEGFEGVDSGLRVMTVLLSQFWETAYPLVEDDDYDYRVAPFEFLNDRLTAAIRLIPLTDPRSSQGYSYQKWKESRDVGYEADGRGDRRAELIAEGKIPAEEFDTAVAKSSAAYYKSLADSIAACVAAFGEMDAAIDEKFGSHAPRISEIGQILDECNRMVVKICREQKGLRDAFDAESDAAEESVPAVAGSLLSSSGEQATQSATGAAVPFPVMGGSDGAQEAALWNEAVRILQGGALKDALNLLLAAAGSQPSERERSRYRFLVAKLCLKAGRPELAKPIVEQLYAMITEFHLENWETPYWIAEIMESLYQCLISAEYADEDPARAQELFRKICTMDVTKALASRM
jgi:type VI secretion system protein ImpA